MSTDLMNRKSELRRQALATRAAVADPDELSRAIIGRLVELQEYRQARTIVWYLGVRTEVRTLPHLPHALTEGKRIAIPWCEGRTLKLFHLENLEELTPGAYKILEPGVELREVAAKQLDPREVDFVVAPGVAFDRAGRRLGHGAGYYDRLLAEVSPRTFLAGLAFQCQMLDEIPSGEHDVPMNVVVTEAAVYRVFQRTMTAP